MTASTTNPPLPTKRRNRVARTRLAADSGFVVIVSLVMAFLYTPILILVIYSFNNNRTLTWPLSGFTTSWYEKLFSNDQLLAAIGNSFYVAYFVEKLALDRRAVG